MALSNFFNDNDDLAAAFDSAETAAELEPIPAGRYVARLTEGDFITSGRGTKGYQLAFEMLEGEHEGRKAWATYWLSPRALPYSKKELARVGITRYEQMSTPPVGKQFKVRIALREGQDGRLHNEVKDVETLADAPPTVPTPREEEHDEAEVPDAEPVSGTTAPRAEVPADLLEDLA